MSRSTKLTPELHQRIVDLIAKGNYAVTACRAAGISESTYYDWLQRGKRGDEGPYAAFARDVEVADAEAEMSAVAVIQTAMDDDPRIAMTFLERRFPERWQNRRPRAEEAAAGPPEGVMVSIRLVTDEDGNRQIFYDDVPEAATEDPSEEVSAMLADGDPPW